MIRRLAPIVLAALLALGLLAAPASAHPRHRIPVSATHHRAPNRQERADLAMIQKVDPRGGCHLEWDGTWIPAHISKKGHHVKGHWRFAWYEVICAR